MEEWMHGRDTVYFKIPLPWEQLGDDWVIDTQISLEKNYLMIYDGPCSQKTDIQ